MKTPDIIRMKDFQREISIAIKGASSLADIEEWCRRQAFVASIEIKPYLLKSNPPQRELIVEINTIGEGVVNRAVHFYELGEGSYKFNGIFHR